MPECQVPGCQRTEAEHRNVAHQFQPTEETLTRRRPVSSSGFPSDPVLRMLLVRKGVVTAVELKGVEEELRSFGLGGGNPGYRRSVAGDREVRDAPKS